MTVEIPAVAEHAVGLLFPGRCALCSNRPQAPSQSLCNACAESVDAERAIPTCPRCAATVAPFEIAKGRCKSCRHSRPRVSATVRVGMYSKEVDGSEGRILTHLGRLTRLYKYQARHELQPLLGGWLADAVARAPWFDRAEALVCVPTHWTRRMTRALYAPAHLVADVSRRIGRPSVPLLRRVKRGRHQIGLSYEERVRNVRGAFALRRGVELMGTRVVLMDDVKTTGATLNECARILREHGAAEVYAAVLVTAGSGRADQAPLAMM